MLLLLLLATGIYVVFGDLAEAAALGVSVLVIIVIALVQERRTERALNALRELASPRARVFRDDAWREIDARDLVPGDLIRIARQRVLARRGAAIETLGAVTVLCVDKTGTLTKNRMSIRRIATTICHDVDPGGAELPEAVHEAVEYGLLACPQHAADPMDQAFSTPAERHGFARRLPTSDGDAQSMRARPAATSRLPGTAFAYGCCMIAAALIPLMFIAGLVVLFVAGAWPIGWLPGIAVMALLVGLAVGLIQTLSHLDDRRTSH